MNIILNQKDLASLSPAARDEIERFIMNRMFSKSEPTAYRDVEDIPEEYGLDDTVKDFTFEMIKDFFSVEVSKTTTLGLRLIAENDKPFIDGQTLSDAGITNIGHFQSRVTTRTRTVTGDPEAYMFGWNEWLYDDEGKITQGGYCVTPITHRSLKKYFKIH